MAKSVSPSEFAEAVGISRSTVLRWCKAALDKGETWCKRDDSGRWFIFEAKARAAISKRTGQRPAAARVRASTRRSKSSDPVADRSPPPVPPDQELGEVPRTEIDLLNNQINVYTKVVKGIAEKIGTSTADPDLNRMLKDSSNELRQLMKRRREVLEADEETIDRTEANQRLIALAIAQRSEWDNLAKTMPALMIEALSRHGFEPPDVALSTRALVVCVEEEVEKILTRLADSAEAGLA